jgi:23S rRNA (pseudouridine1915-N3)-methyltransferase
MKVEFWCISKTDEPYIREGLGIYVKKLQPYLSFQYREIIPPKTKKSGAEQHQLMEKEEIFRLLKPADMLILLDEKGEQFNSTGFAAFMQKKFNATTGNIIFLAGGAYGFHKETYERANSLLALSGMTFTHQMVRLIFLEQLYRAMTILRNEPYHH